MALLCGAAPLCGLRTATPLHAEETDEADPILERLEQSTLPAQPGYAVDNIEIDIPGGHLRFKEGTFFVDRIEGQRVHELVFVGKGSMRVDPADEIERYQMQLHGSSERMERRFNRAVLLVGGEQAAGLLAGISPAAQPRPGLSRARSMYETWVQWGPRNTVGRGVRPLLAALHDDAVGRSYFAAWLHDGAEDRDFYFRNDPWEQEPYEAGELRIPDKPKEGEIPEELLERDWFCDRMIWTRFGGSEDRDEPGLKPRTHKLDLKLRGKELEAAGTAAIEARANTGGMRVITTTMASGMEITEAFDGFGEEIKSYSTGPFHFLVLPQPVKRDETLELNLTFSGTPIRRWAGKQAQESAAGWYPRLTGIYRSAFHARLEWPRDQTLLAAGTLVDSGETEESLWEERVTETPMMWFSFEIGNYEVYEAEAGHISLRLGIERRRDPMPQSVRKQIMAGLQASILFYETTFGMLPIDDMTVVVVDKQASQGLLSFITLARDAMLPTASGMLDADDSKIRLETVSHEMAHQWWGNIVGWVGYRDQWLSEALADYCAVQFMLQTAKDREAYLTSRASNWKYNLTESSNIGRPNYSLGPVTLGTRLFFNHGVGAYQAVVYEKGSVVFTTLARQIGREAMWEMLKNLYEAVNNRLISTENFLGAMQHMSGMPLDAFAERYIYGVDIPRVYYRYESEERNGTWTITGETEHLVGLRREVRLAFRDRRWHIDLMDPTPDDLSGWRLAVPFRVRLEDGNYQGGHLEIHGDRGRFSLELAGKPERFELDPLDEVLANTVCISCGVGRNHLQYARDLYNRGRTRTVREEIERAVEAYRADGDEKGALRAKMALAQFQLDQGEVSDAIDRLKQLRKEIKAMNYKQQRFEWLALEARIDLLRGARGSAMARLTELAREMDTVNYFTSGDTEILALLAAAAHEADRPELARAASRTATSFGADMSALGY